MLACAGAARAATAPESFTLDNGLKVVVIPDHRTPVVTQMIWYKVGSADETPGQSGLAHFLEHLMFKGTARHPEGEFSKTVSRIGGNENAFTSYDYTAYYQQVAPEALPEMMAMEADRMTNLILTDDVIGPERDVIIEERNMRVENDPRALLSEEVSATLYQNHPYRFPVIGWMHEIVKLNRDDAIDFYRRYYAPNNAVLVVAGDVEPAQVFAMADKYLAALPRQPEPTPITTVEPEQQGERRIVVEKADAQSPLLAYAFHSGLGAGDKDYPTLELLTAILSQGDSSRLHQRLVEREQAAVDVGAFAESGFDPGLLWVYAALPPGGDLAKAEELLDDELAKIARDGVSAAELDKVRNLKASAFWRNMATINGKARVLGTYEVFNGDYRKAFDAPAAYAAVGANDVQALAKKILRVRNRTTGLLVPVMSKPVAADKEAAK